MHNQISLWTNSELYQYDDKCPPQELFRRGDDFFVNDMFIDTINKRGYVLIARANNMFDKLISILSVEKKIYLSMWKGYVDEKEEAYNENLAKSVGSEYKHLHTSGHCDMKSMRDMFRQLQPKAIIPIHTDKPDKFAELFCNEWQVIRLNDGQCIQLPISEH